MRIHKQFFKSIALTALLSTSFAAYGIAQDTTTIVNPETQAPIILGTSPTGGELNVALGDVIEITFSSDMDESSINETTLLLHATYVDTMYEERSDMIMDEQRINRSAIKNPENRVQHSTGVVGGTISYFDKVAVFTPNEDFNEGTMYTFTVTNGVKDLDNIPLQSNHSWSFTTIGTTDSTFNDKQNKGNGYGIGGIESRPMPDISTNRSTNKMKFIDLGKAAHFVILAEAYVNNESGSKISGRIGEGSLAKSARKEAGILNSAKQSNPGQKLVMKSNQGDTTSANVAEAIKDMKSAYADAALQYGKEATSHKSESLQSTVLTPGVHEWSDTLHISSDVTLSGSANDVWLFKAGKNLTVDENTTFTLTNGAQAENVFWYVEGEVTIGKDAHFEGIILSMNEINLEKGAKLNGRMYSQTSITLNDNTITEPRNLAGQTTSTNE